MYFIECLLICHTIFIGVMTFHWLIFEVILRNARSNNEIHSLPTVCLYIMIVFHAVISAHYCPPYYELCMLFDSVVTKGKVKGKFRPVAGSQGQEGE